jgi:hypothetical protein
MQPRRGLTGRIETSWQRRGHTLAQIISIRADMETVRIHKDNEYVLLYW